MPDPTLKTTFVADDTSTANALARMQKEMSQLRDTMKGAKEDAHAHHEENESGFKRVTESIQEQVLELASVVTAYASIEKAIDLAIDAQREYDELLKQSAEHAEKHEKTLIETLAQSGRAGKMGQYMEALDNSGMLDAEKEQALKGAANVVGLSDQETMRAAKSAGNMQEFAGNMEQAATVLGSLAKLAPALNDRTLQNLYLGEMGRVRPQDQAEMTSARGMAEMRGLAGSGAFGQGQAGLEGAMAFQVAMANEGLKGRGLAQATAILEGTIEPSKPHKRGEAASHKDQAMDALRGMSPQQRIAYLSDHPEAVDETMPSHDRQAWKRAFAAMPGIQAGLHHDVTSDLLAEQRRGLFETDAGREAREQRLDALKAEETARIAKPEGQMVDRFRRKFDQEIDRELAAHEITPNRATVSRGMYSGVYRMETVAGTGREGASIDAFSAAAARNEPLKQVLEQILEEQKKATEEIRIQNAQKSAASAALSMRNHR